jgi:hypothetical protein
VLALFIRIPVFWTAVYGNRAVADGVARHRCIDRLEFLFMNVFFIYECHFLERTCNFQSRVKLGVEIAEAS